MVRQMMEEYIKHGQQQVLKWQKYPVQHTNDKYQQSVQITKMQGNQVPKYLLSFKIPETATFDNLFHFLSEPAVSSEHANLSNSPPALSQRQILLGFDKIVAKIRSVFMGHAVDLAELEDFALFMSDAYQEFTILNKKGPSPLTPAISIAITVSLRTLMPTQSQNLQKVRGMLLKSLSQQQANLSQRYTFQLFISLVQVQLEQITHETPQSRSQSIPTFLQYFILIQQYLTGNEQYFKVIRNILSLLNPLISTLPQVPQPLPQSSSLSSPLQPQDTTSTISQKFYQTLQKYILIDPEYRIMLLSTIKQLFYKDGVGEHVLELFRVAVSVMNRKIFQEYQGDVMKMLVDVAKGLEKEKQRQKQKQVVFQKMVVVLFKQKRSPQFLLTHKNHILPLAISEQISIKLFSLYYQQIFTLKKIKQKSNRIFNALTEWNLKYGMMPADKFIPELISLGVEKLSEDNQKLVFGCAHVVGSPWAGLALKIVENKCREFLEGRLDFQSVLNDQCFNQSVEVYCIYTKMFIQVLTSIQAHKFLTNPPETIILHQNMQLLKKSRYYSKLMLKKAMKNKVQQHKFVQPFCLLNSLLEIIRPTRLDRVENLEFYYGAIRGFQGKVLGEFLGFMGGVFRICKNAFALFIILACGLVIHSNQKQGQDQIKEIFSKVLDDVHSLVSSEGYTKIISHNAQNLRQLILLTYISQSQKLNKKCQQLISAWAALYTRAQIQLILYQFDPTLFTPITTTLPITPAPPESNIQKYTINTLTQLVLLLKHPPCLNTAYFSNINNMINFIPIRHSNHRNSLVIQFKVLVNPRLCCNSGIEVYGTSRVEGIQSTYKHRIIFKNKRIIFYNRVTKEIQGSFQQISQQLYNKPFTITLEFLNQTLTIKINKTELLSKTCNFLVDNIRFDLNGDLLIKQLKWQRFDQEYKYLQPSCTFQVFPSQAEIKLTKVQHYFIGNFQEKVEIGEVCGLLGEIGRNVGVVVDMNRFYGLCCEIILHKQGAAKYQFNQIQVSYIKKLFKQIFKQSQHISKLDLPERTFKDIHFNLNTNKFYDFLVAAVINEQFLSQATRECKLRVVALLQELLFNSNSEFRLGQENQKEKMFIGLCKAMQHMDKDVQEKYSALIQKILLTHEGNETFLKKISYIFSLAHGNKYEYAQNLFQKLFQKIFSVINHSQNEQNYHIKILGRFFLSTHKNLKLIFLLVNIDIKIKILYSMIDDQQLYLRCHALFEDLTATQLLELSGWLVVYCKQTMLEFFQQKKYNTHKLLNLLFLLRLITVVYDVETDQGHKQAFLTIINNFLLRSVKLMAEKCKLAIIQQQVQNFFCHPNLISLLAKKVDIYINSEIKDKLLQNLIINYFENLLSRMPKHVILKALQQFRKIPDIGVDCCIFILKLDYVSMLPVKALSPFLQYLIEMVFITKISNQEINILKVGEAVNEYLEKLIKNYGAIKQNLVRPLLYSFPKLQRKIDFSIPSNVTKAIQKVKQAQIYEIKGGVYLKLIVLNFHLMEILPHCDLSHRIAFFLDKVRDKCKIVQPIYRATNDFIQVSVETKLRTNIDVAMQEVQQQHQKYFQNSDEEIITATSSPIRRSNSKIDIDTDLTPFFIDYFFMRMFYFLENYCKRLSVESEQQKKIYDSYSKSTLNYLKKFQQISDEMSQKNVSSILTYETVEDLSNLIKLQEDITISDRMNSPDASSRRFTNEDDSKFGFGDINFSDINSAFVGTPKKSEQGPKLRSALSFDFTSGKKKKKELLLNVETDTQAWSKEALMKKVHRFFRDQSKQILFYELLHQLYVLSSTSSQKRESQKPKGKHLIGFLKEQCQQLFEQDKLSLEHWKKNMQKIRRVYKFTTPNRPQLALQRTSFPNLTYPFIHHQTSPIQISHHPLNIFGLNSTELARNIDFQYSLNSPDPNLDTIVCLANQDEDLELSDNLCEVVYPMGVYFCGWEIQEGQQNKIVFLSKGEKRLEGKGNFIENQRLMIRYGAPDCSIIKQEGKKVELVVSDILEIFYRKYNQIMNNSLQFFLKNGQSIFVAFYTEPKTKNFLEKCKNTLSNFRFIKTVENYMKSFQNEGFTEKWVAGDLTNFDYLMLVNKYAGRSLSDLSQYYVFPWILEDYTSDTLDISNPKIYRDLRKPIGALREQKLQRFKQKLSNSTRYEDGQYLYGSHYSASLFIFYYLVRLEPFTSLHIDMQSGKFDAPDRLFSSIQQMWESLISQTSPTDIKQAIPEFYYFPAFLKNINKLDLGRKQCGTVVDAVELPPWASSPEDFILKMRACLESHIVSSNLNYWIDLIFGHDQKSMDKNNVFLPISYYENIKPERIPIQKLDATMSQISFYGQNPYPLFTREHPKKKIKLSSSSIKNISLYTSLDLKQSTTPNTAQIYEQENLEMIYYVSDLSFKNRNVIVIKISGISKSYMTRTVDLDMDNTIHSLIRTIQKNQVQSMKRLLSQNDIEVPELKLLTSSKINQSQIEISLKVKQKVSVIKTIKLHYNFNSIKFNETVFVVYGSAGLRVYDWTQEIIWEFSNKFGEVSDLFLEYGLIFFATCTGKVFVYDFFSRSQDVVFEYPKATYHLSMLVYPQHKLITKKNQNSYKFVLVGDRRRIILLHYTHKTVKSKLKY